MELFFDWCESLTVEKKEWRGDEHIVSIEIFQKEFSFASAKILLAASKRKLQRFAKIAIKHNGNFYTIFSGRLTGFPIGFRGSTVQIEMIAEPDDYQQQLTDFIKQKQKQNLHKNSNELIEFDDLFYSTTDSQNPTVLLEGSNDIFFWNARTGKLSISHISKGTRCLQISASQILQNSIKMHMAREPYSEIEVSISAKWRKYQPVTLDIFPLIAQQFSNNLVNSFTDIRADFEKINNCTYCNVREINPNTMGCLTRYPLRSNEFFIEQKKYSFKRFYYDGNIIFNLNYTKRMQETVRFKLKKNSKNQHIKRIHFDLNSLQLPQKYPHWNAYTHYCVEDSIIHNEHIWKCKKDHFSEQNFDETNWIKIEKILDAIPDDSITSFFETIRGQNAIKYAAQKALALLNYSQRYIEVTFGVLLDEFFDISLDDEIVLKDIGDYYEEIHGKVIKLQMIAAHDKAYIKVTIGCGASENLDWEKLKNWIPTVAVENSDEDIPLEEIVRSIEIINPPEQQHKLIQNFHGESISELQQSLANAATKVKVIMKSQSKVTTINREINLPDITIG